MGLFKKKDKGDGPSPAPQAANPYAKPPANPYQQAKARAYAGSEQSNAGSPPPPYENGRAGPGGPGGPGGYGGRGAPGGPGGPGGPEGRGGYPQEKQNPYAPANGGYQQQDRYGAGPPGGGYGGNRDAGGRNGGHNGGGSGGGGGYGANPYGQAGYGNDRYGGGAGGQGGPQGNSSRYGAGGYGGMGGGSSSDNPYASNDRDDGSRNALFGAPPAASKEQGGPAPNPYAPGGANRYAPGGQSNGPSGAPQRSNPYDPANPHDGGNATSSSYGGRELTAEEEEEQEVQATKNEIRAVKQQTVASSRNALRAAARAEEIGRDTLARLGAQGEAIHNAEMNLDLAHNHNKRAEDKARELKTLNRSMFAVHVSNPFTSKARQEAADQAVIDRRMEEKEARETTRRAGYLANQRMQQNFSELDKNGEGQAKRERNLAERAKYQFEADSEDDEMEDELDNNTYALEGAARRLNQVARATGKEVDEQNKRLDVLASKSDKVDLGLAANQARIDRIK